MCGRYTIIANRESLAEALDLPPEAIPEDVAPRYNVAPTQLVPILLQEGAVRMAFFRWGLVPPWADDLRAGARRINARRETIASKRSFRESFRDQRCLVIADGFYEWHAAEPGKPKVPYYVRMKSGEPFTFAGLWARWRSPAGEEVLTCTIITGEANDLLREIHHRMPIIIPPHNRAAWLDPDHRNEEALLSLLRPYDPEEMEMFPVSRYVNSPANDGAQCIVPEGPRETG